jgi:hypothetical protein
MTKIKWIRSKECIYRDPSYQKIKTNLNHIGTQKYCPKYKGYPEPKIIKIPNQVIIFPNYIWIIKKIIKLANSYIKRQITIINLQKFLIKLLTNLLIKCLLLKLKIYHQK